VTADEAPMAVALLGSAQRLRADRPDGRPETRSATSDTPTRTRRPRPIRRI
jgi:hypothetical protein